MRYLIAYLVMVIAAPVVAVINNLQFILEYLQFIFTGRILKKHKKLEKMEVTTIVKFVDDYYASKIVNKFKDGK